MRGLVELITARINTETGHTSICKYMQTDNDDKERREYTLKAGASHTGECTPVFFLLLK